jgi:hypothetical protein
MRTLVLVLFVICVVIWIALQLTYARTKNADIEARFIERIDYIPSIVAASALLTFVNFQLWLTDPEKANVRGNYTLPILVPFDYLFLISLGLFLGFGSVEVSGHLVSLHTIPPGIRWIFPSLYIASDFLEDSVLVALFTAKLNLTNDLYRFLRVLTKAKIATVSAAIGQLCFLMALWGLLRLYPAAGCI